MITAETANFPFLLASVIPKAFAEHMATRGGTTSLKCFLPGGWNTHGGNPASIGERGGMPAVAELKYSRSWGPE